MLKEALLPFKEIVKCFRKDGDLNKKGIGNFYESKGKNSNRLS